MFGTNKQAKQSPGDGRLLEVVEIFSTIQGEGPFAGQPAIFIRLTGCHLKCYYCDTSFDTMLGSRAMDVTDVLNKVTMLSRQGKRHQTNLVVITGGEPLRQNIVPLCNLLQSRDYMVQIETAGNFWPEGLEECFDWGVFSIVCSPKTGSVHPKIAEYCDHWKYLIREGCVSEVDGLPNVSTQVPGLGAQIYRPSFAQGGTIWVQPCEEYDVSKVALGTLGKMEADQVVTGMVRNEDLTRRNVQLAASIAMKFNYRISYQLHKILGLK